MAGELPALMRPSIFALALSNGKAYFLDYYPIGLHLCPFDSPFPIMDSPQRDARYPGNPFHAQPGL